MSPVFRPAWVFVSLACLPFAATPAFAQTTAVFVHSEAGDDVGGGAIRDLLPPAATFEALGPDRLGAVTVTVRVGTAETWHFSLNAPDLRLKPGVYGPALGLSASVTLETQPNVFTERACTTRTGRFVVYELEYDFLNPFWSGGRLSRFAADIEQHCNDATPALFAAIRYNSTISGLLPFDGRYPRYELSVTAPPHGIVIGAGIACGHGQTTCTSSFGTATTTTLTAVPAPGYVFAGWTGACSGAETITINVNTLKECGAAFNREPPAEPQRFLSLNSPAGDPIGGGKDRVYSGPERPNARLWRVTSLGGGNGIEVRIAGTDSTRILEFRAPYGVLAPGTYLNAPTRMTVLGPDGRPVDTGCSSFRTDLIVGVVQIDGTQVRGFQVSFDDGGWYNLEQRCGLEGALSWNSDRIPILGSLVLQDYSQPPGSRTQVFSTAETRPAPSIWSASVIDAGNGVRVNVDAMEDTAVSSWTLDFKAPSGKRLAAGTYLNAARAPTMLGHGRFWIFPPILNVRTTGRECTSITGDVVVKELVIEGTTVSRFAVDFEQHCNAPSAPPLTGKLRWNSLQDLSVCGTPDPFAVLGGGTCYQGGWRPPGMPLPAPSGSDCSTPDPFVALGGGTCVDGGWLPPGHPGAVIGSSAGPAGSSTPSANPGGSTTCTTTQPGPSWVCVNGGWVPPDHPLALSGSSSSTGSSGTTSCTTVRPGPAWVCVNGGWVPPDHPLARGGG